MKINLIVFYVRNPVESNFVKILKLANTGDDFSSYEYIYEILIH